MRIHCAIATLLRFFLVLCISLVSSTSWLLTPKNEFASKEELDFLSQELIKSFGRENIYNQTRLSSGRIHFWTLETDTDRKTTMLFAEYGDVRAYISSLGVDYFSDLRLQELNIEENTSIFMTELTDSDPELVSEQAFEARREAAPKDLKLLSWPPRKPLPVPPLDLPPYVYDDVDGKEVYVYIVDQGISESSEVSVKQWLVSVGR